MRPLARSSGTPRPRAILDRASTAVKHPDDCVRQLTRRLVITGVLGAVIVTPLMNAMGVRDYAARGFAAGVAAHGIGAARAFAVDPLAGTMAGIAMGLNAVFSSLLVPVFVRLFMAGG